MDKSKNPTPQVSIVIPCYNEERTIGFLLESIALQTFPVELMEVIIADGLSVDNTRKKIAEFKTDHPQLSIRVIDNTKKIIPAALNLAIRAACGEIIVRMDAHAVPAVDYVEKCVLALRSELGDNVGGVIDIKPGKSDWIGWSISIATSHRLGVGDAMYRRATTAGEADTVAFGAYYKKTVEEIGFYNEALMINEDYEFNARLRISGRRIWVDPEIRVTYFSRPTIAALAKQYFSYGFWKFKMLRRFPKTLRWRQALPPLFVLGLLMLLLLTIFWFPGLWFFFGTLVLYLAILLVSSINYAVSRKDASLLVGIPLAIITMHFSWGLGFWKSVFEPEKRDSRHGN
jgi:succinoglycan biosynthesis protein ExoA